MTGPEHYLEAQKDIDTANGQDATYAGMAGLWQTATT